MIIAEKNISANEKCLDQSLAFKNVDVNCGLSSRMVVVTLMARSNSCLPLPP